MSNSAGSTGGGFVPAKPSKLTISEFQEMGEFFKKLIEETRLAKWVIVAGIASAIQAAHVLWLAVRFLLHR